MLIKSIYLALLILMCGCSTMKNPSKESNSSFKSVVNEQASEINLITRPIPILPKTKGPIAYTGVGLAGIMTIIENCIYFKITNPRREDNLALMVFPEGAYIENPGQSPVKIRVTDAPMEISITESQEVVWSAGLFNRSEEHIKKYGCKGKLAFRASHIVKPIPVKS